MRILLADDHALMRDTLREYLAPLDPDLTVIEAESLDGVISAAQAPAFDLILLDMHMPGMAGPASVAQVRATFPQTRIVVVSGEVDQGVIAAALRAGADGYIPKSSRGKAFLTALRLVLEGEIYVPPTMVQNAQAVPETPSASAASNSYAVVPLTAREREVLTLLISGKSNKHIGRELNLQEVTVKVHLRNLYRKINATNRTDAVRIALMHGWSP